MTTFAVQYTYDDRDARRDEVRPAHRAFLEGLLEAGSLLASGPFADDGGAPGALLIVAADSDQGAADLLDDDPFARDGLLAARVIRAWIPVYGPWTD
ncbi:MAG: YciI family protein [Cellulomonas sp.]